MSTLSDVHEFHTPTEDDLPEIVRALSRPQRHLPCKYFYDRTGSQLFDRICEQPEYYATRTEAGILQQNANDMVMALNNGGRLVELGAGSSVKTRILLDAIVGSAVYMPIDISREHLLEAARNIAADYPHLEVIPIVADYTKPFQLPEPTEGQPTLVFFPGGTFGNFEPETAIGFLRQIAQIAGKGNSLLIGIDLQKDREILERAYNDSAGVTAAFNLNILDAINAVHNLDFDRGRFEHRAVYDEERGRIEMRLVSTKEHAVKIGEKTFSFAPGDYIVTEYSHKFTVDGFGDIARQAGFRLENVWQDAERLFAVCHLLVESRPGT